MLFALGALSLPFVPLGTLSILPSLPPMPSRMLPFSAPFAPGVLGHPPGGVSVAGVAVVYSADLLVCSLDMRLFVCDVVWGASVVLLAVLLAKAAGMSLAWWTMKMRPAWSSVLFLSAALWSTTLSRSLLSPSRGLAPIVEASSSLLPSRTMPTPASLPMSPAGLCATAASSAVQWESSMVAWLYTLM